LDCLRHMSFLLTSSAPKNSRDLRGPNDWECSCNFKAGTMVTLTDSWPVFLPKSARKFGENDAQSRARVSRFLSTLARGSDRWTRILPTDCTCRQWTNLFGADATSHPRSLRG